MSIKPQFANSTNWDLIDSGTVLATKVNPAKDYYNPINPINISVQISSPTVAIFTETNNPKSTWSCGGWLSANIVSGLIVGGNSDAEIAKKWLRLEKINIIRFPSLSNSYSLILFAPSWFESISWVIWEYIGSGHADLEGKLDLIYEEIINN